MTFALHLTRAEPQAQDFALETMLALKRQGHAVKAVFMSDGSPLALLDPLRAQKITAAVRELGAALYVCGQAAAAAKLSAGALPAGAELAGNAALVGLALECDRVAQF